MHNCLVLGCGRSGTSLTTGLLNDAGYFFGANPIEARGANPKGFFEDHLVNYVNEQIMRERVGYSRLPAWLTRGMGRTPFRPAQLWLAALDQPVRWSLDQRIEWIIRDLVTHRPFALKDPRFCYTLNAWRPFLNDCKFICVFRDPSIAASSIAKEVATEPYYRNLRLGVDHALKVWKAMYRQVLDFHCTDESDWLFVEYDQLLAGSAFDAIGQFLDTKVDGNFVDPNLNRSRPEKREPPRDVQEIYQRLQAMAATTRAAALSADHSRQ